MFVHLILFSALSQAADPYGKGEAVDAYGKSGANHPVALGTEKNKDLTIGAPVTVGGVTVYPVIDRTAPKQSATTTVSLAEAMTTGQLRVREAGSFSTLQFENVGKAPVAILAGEVIRGGRQDRVITEDLEIPPTRTPIVASVHCVERSRWSDHAATFAYGGRAEYALRSVLEKDNQEATWETVAALNSARSASPTGAYVSVGGDTWMTYRQQLHAQMADQQQVVGAIVAQGDQLVFAEMFGTPSRANAGRAAALDGYARDAVVMDANAEPPPNVEAAAAYLEQMLQ
ncbi:MAG: DUF6569 family protein [Myxococcota bacterium]